MWLILCLLGCEAVQGLLPSEPPPEPVAVETAPTRPPAPGTLSVPSSVVVGQQFDVKFDAPGRDSCYRQEDEGVKFGEFTITHRYRTFSEGTDCKTSIVQGGIKHEVRLAKPGTWTGFIERDGKVVSRYTISASKAPPRDPAEKKR